MNNSYLKYFYAASLLIALIVIYFLLANSDLADLFTDMEILIYKAQSLGNFGPLLLIGLMVLAIVFNPLPSAPIAIAAGAVYGHTLGTIYVVIGAEIGAIAAFLMARAIGADLVRKITGDSISLGRFGTQNGLTMIVFISRLVPFMSFDLVSYAAGLTAIKLWRFALATLLGLVPISFALAHMGSEVTRDNQQKLALIVLIVGLLMAIPLILGIMRNSGKAAGTGESEEPL
ncbi:MAG: TVP38/TMEM64 family protein [Gammaproteobacteria bacterium]|nr:TVP38/TMEM64 family protein [Gammaproteobacteria bacterium]